MKYEPNLLILHSLFKFRNETFFDWVTFQDTPPPHTQEAGNQNSKHFFRKL